MKLQKENRLFVICSASHSKGIKDNIFGHGEVGYVLRGKDYNFKKAETALKKVYDGYTKHLAFIKEKYMLLQKSFKKGLNDVASSNLSFMLNHIKYRKSYDQEMIDWTKIICSTIKSSIKEMTKNLTKSEVTKMIDIYCSLEKSQVTIEQLCNAWKKEAAYSDNIIINCSKKDAHNSKLQNYVFEKIDDWATHKKKLPPLPPKSKRSK